MAGEAGGEAKAIAIIKNGGDLWLGGNRPEGDDASCCEISLSRCQQQTQSSPRSANQCEPIGRSYFLDKLSCFWTRSRACPRRRRDGSSVRRSRRSTLPLRVC